MCYTGHVTQTLKTRPSLPQRLRAARIDAGISQGKAAEAVGFSREHLNRFEQGHRWSPELAYRLARHLNIRVTFADLFPDVEPPGDSP